ncbi:MAG TPA: carboxymuconolactone decarboxylase family protein [Acidimicrobiales bacterium]|nr:carboxymuconolactone decarboxylase family protein [Acidimicrobiales bacterium]
MRVDLVKVWPDGYQALAALEAVVTSSGLETSLIELIKMRVSQINQCAYCIDMHSKDARALGETEQRLYALSAWRETPFFTPRERAALALAESITLLSATHVPDDVVDEAKEHFSADELAKVVFAAITINAWNRVAVTSQVSVGGYVSPHAHG